MNFPENVLQKDYLINIEAGFNKGTFFDASARNIINGKYYNIRFIGKRIFYFFIFENKIWKTYLLNANVTYNRKAFCSINDFEQLESEIANGLETPLAYIKNGRVILNNSREEFMPLLPKLPFYFRDELSKLDLFENRERYRFNKAPKYLVFARRTKYINNENQFVSHYVYGCDRDYVYEKIRREGGIVVTNTYEKIRAIAVYKTENIYNIVPKQACIDIY